MSCIFCQALRPSTRLPLVYANGSLAILMDAYPIVPGHLLVFDRAHLADPFDLPPARYRGLMELVRSVVVAQRRGLESPRCGVFTAGKEVGDHGHVHILPLREGLKRTFSGLGSRPRPRRRKRELLAQWRRIEAHLAATAQA